MGDGRGTDATTDDLWAALGLWDEHVREVRFVARGEGTVGALLAARLRGWPGEEIRFALARSGALGAEGDGARPLVPGDEVLMRRVVREPRVPVRWHVVHEDARVVVVDKGPGYPVHPAGAFVERTLLRAMRRGGYDVHPVHRLDRETSGLVVLARDRSTLRDLSETWGSVRKRYLAMVAPAPDWDVLSTRAPVGPARGAEQVRQQVRSDGKEAVTHLRVLRRSPRAALISCEPETGRQHQIRVHLAALGCPLVGDKLYRDDPLYLRLARGEATAEELRGLGHPRHALHAAELWLADGLHLVTPLPADLRELAAALGLPDGGNEVSPQAAGCPSR